MITSWEGGKFSSATKVMSKRTPTNGPAQQHRTPILKAHLDNFEVVAFYFWVKAFPVVGKANLLRASKAFLAHHCA